MSMIMNLFSFFDLAFLRVIFNLIVDYLISTGYLLPQQRDQWVNGWSHIIGIIGAVIFMAIWQHQSHKKEITKTTVSPAGLKTVEKTTIAPVDETPNIAPIQPEQQPVKISDII